MATYCCYILYSKKLDSYYIGETENVSQRLVWHNSGKFKGSSTSRTNDWQIFLEITCVSREQARRIEKHIKRMKSRRYIENLKIYPNILIGLKERYL